MGARPILLLIIFLTSVFSLTGQSGGWLDVPDNETGVRVEMPDLPTFSRPTVSLAGRTCPTNVFLYEDQRFRLYFEVIRTGNDSGRKIRKAALQQLRDQINGKLLKQETLEKEGTEFQYTEWQLPEDWLARIVIFETRGRLFRVWLEGPRKHAFSLAANQYLNSWALGVPTPEVPGAENEVVAVDDMSGPVGFFDDWAVVNVSNGICAAFPSPPFHKTTIVEFGTEQVTLEAWSRHSDDNRHHYVVTRRAYGPEEGQLDDDALFEYVIGQIQASSRYKVVGQKEFLRQGIRGEEYILVRGRRFYRLQLFRYQGALYQCLVRGKRKSIYEAGPERFFGGVKCSTP